MQVKHSFRSGGLLGYVADLHSLYPPISGGEVHKNKIPFLYVCAIVYSSKQVKGKVSALQWKPA